MTKLKNTTIPRRITTDLDHPVLTAFGWVTVEIRLDAPGKVSVYIPDLDVGTCACRTSGSVSAAIHGLLVQARAEAFAQNGRHTAADIDADYWQRLQAARTLSRAAWRERQRIQREQGVGAPGSYGPHMQPLVDSLNAMSESEGK